MADESKAANVFGQTVNPPGFLTDDLQPTPEEPPPTPPAEPAAPEPQKPAEPAPEPTEPPAEPTEPAGQEPPRQYAGKYASVEELEKGYWNIQALEARRREEMAQLYNRNQEVEQALQNMVPYLEQLQQQPQAPQQPLPPLPNFEENPQAWAQAFAERTRLEMAQELQAQLQQALPNALSPVQNQIQQQQQMFQQQQEAQARALAEGRIVPILEEWRTKHNVTANSPQEEAAASMTATYGLPIDDADALDFAFELSQNPVLAAQASRWSETVGSTGWARTAGGRAYVRQAAGINSAPASAPARPRQPAHVESGGSGAPITSPPGERPEDQNDPFGPVLKLARERKELSPLFGGRS